MGMSGGLMGVDTPEVCRVGGRGRIPGTPDEPGEPYPPEAPG